MKVLVYTDDYGAGGAGEYTHRIAMALKQRGFDVIYAQTQVDTPQKAQREAVGIRHRGIMYDTIAYILHTTRDVLTPTRILSEEMPDVVLFSDCLPESTIGAKRAAAFLDIPFVSTKNFVGDGNYMAHYPEVRNDAEAALRQARCVICVSHENRRRLLRMLDLAPERVRTVHYGRPETFFAPRQPERRAVLRREWGVAEDEVLFLTAAQFVKRKGHDYIVRAMKRLRQDGKLDRMRFVWAGNDACDVGIALRARLADLKLADRVVFAGHRTDMDACFDAADAFLLPAEWEGMPLVIMEAMAKSLPVIASAVSGIPEEIADTGMLLPNPTLDAGATVSELALALERLTNDGPLRRDLAQRTRARAEAMFREARMADETAQILVAAAFPEGDHLSPGLKAIKAKRAFPFMVRYTARHHGERSGLLSTRQALYLDSRFPEVEFLSRDEALILHTMADRMQGRAALVFGGWTGWSAYHLIAAGMNVDVAEARSSDMALRATLNDAMIGGANAAAGTPSLSLAPTNDPSTIAALAQQRKTPWSLAVLDAEGQRVAPLPFVQNLVPHCAADATIVLARGLSPQAVEAGRWLMHQGWRPHLYHTAHVMLGFSRGNAAPIAHTPDPHLPNIPDHLRDFIGGGFLIEL